MPLPNFFVIGAPKSGTTALYDALVQHPEIYMSPVKEPLFFDCDGEPQISPGPIGSFMKRNAIWQRSEYMALFADVKSEQAIGEASVVYLRSPVAAGRIHRSLPQSKLVAILRHPAERAHSHYWFSVQNGIEPARSFEEALAHEASGLRNEWFSEFHHRNNGFYFEQLSRYYALFPREQIKIYLYEDWQDNPHKLLSDLFYFLQVDESFAPTFNRTNVTRAPRMQRLNNWAQQPNHLRARLQGILPRRFQDSLIAGVQTINHKYNWSRAPRIGSQTYAQLVQEYREDILKLEDLIERDLSHWLKA